jgi:hypothetical protein
VAYTKTVWEDLPSTDTPITANNLNNIEDGIEEVHNNKIHDLIQIGIDTNPWILTANTLTTIPFNYVSQKIGDLLNLQNNKIVVGGTGIRGKLRLYVMTTSGGSTSNNYVYCYIYKNGTEIIDMMGSGAGTGNRALLSQDVILDYESGDEFEFKMGSDAQIQVVTTYYRTRAYIELLTYEEAE